MHQRRLILFTRYPTPGQVKTRLIPALGGDGAAALHRRLVQRALRTADNAARQIGADLEIRYSGGTKEEMSHWLGDSHWYRQQQSGDLGARMAGAFAESFDEGATAVVIIGSDCPSLTPSALVDAFGSLESNSVVFGPALDGGYYLLGLTRKVPALFQGIAWGTTGVLAQSVQISERHAIKPGLLQPLGDIDRPQDLAAWRLQITPEESDLRRISVIIPALNEAPHLAATLQSVRSCHEIVLVDGGSTDKTREIGRAAGANVVLSNPGRARQMNAGAAKASGNVLLFLHADTLLPTGWQDAVAHCLRNPSLAAGAFRFRIADDFRGRRLVEWGAHLRSRWFQCPYGDQALFLRRAAFEELGGFAALPIMEDYALVSKLRRRGRIYTLSEAVITSGRRWYRLGVIRTTFINQVVLAGFQMGVPGEKLVRWYRST